MSTLEVTDLPVPAKDERFPSVNQALNCWLVLRVGDEEEEEEGICMHVCCRLVQLVGWSARGRHACCTCKRRLCAGQCAVGCVSRPLGVTTPA